MFSVPGFQNTEFTANGPRPTYTESEFKICFPAANGTLPVRKEWLESMKLKFVHPKIVAEFEEAIKLHNKEMNPPGQPYDPSRGLARQAEQEPKRDIADPIPEDPTAPKDKAELEKRAGILASLTHRGQVFHFTKGGGLWVWGESDDVLSSTECIAQIFGEFVLDAAATKALEKSPALVWQWQIHSAEHLAVYRADSSSITNTFGATVKPLSAFLEFLDKNGQHSVQIDLHEVTPQYKQNDVQEVVGRSWVIKPQHPCVFKPLAVPKKVSLLAENLGSCLTTGNAAGQWNWSTGVHNMGFTRIVDRMAFESSTQFVGIVPEKPGIFLAKDIRVAKGTLRQLA